MQIYTSVLDQWTVYNLYIDNMSDFTIRKSPVKKYSYGLHAEMFVSDLPFLFSMVFLFPSLYALHYFFSKNCLWKFTGILRIRNLFVTLSPPIWIMTSFQTIMHVNCDHSTQQCTTKYNMSEDTLNWCGNLILYKHEQKYQYIVHVLYFSHYVTTLRSTMGVPIF